MRRFVLIFALAAASAVLAGSAVADSVYHTAQIPLQPQGGAPGSGIVINIHANGPTVYAHELYLLKSALPGGYQVMIHIDPVNLDCSAPALDLPTATLQTNAAGNGFADHFFIPADADGLRGHTVSAFWTVTGPATYQTACSLVTLD
ncbi:MAG: hypothetical protein ACXVY6_06175 [Gaiellaceae bacterium]